MVSTRHTRDVRTIVQDEVLMKLFICAIQKGEKLGQNNSVDRNFIETYPSVLKNTFPLI